MLSENKDKDFQTYPEEDEDEDTRRHIVSVLCVAVSGSWIIGDYNGIVISSTLIPDNSQRESFSHLAMKENYLIMLS